MEVSKSVRSFEKLQIKLLLLRSADEIQFVCT